jgi:hypothetical protein
MPLNLIVENLENVKPEMRENYVKQGDGKYQLDLRDLEPYVDNKLKSLKSDLENTREHERKLLLEDGLSAALQRANIIPNGHDLLLDRLSKRVALDTEGGKRVVRITQAGSEMLPMAGSGEGGRATLDDLVQEAVVKYPSMFSEGGGKPPSEAGGSGEKTITRAEFNKLSPLEQGAKIRAGIALVDAPTKTRTPPAASNGKTILRAVYEKLEPFEQASKVKAGIQVVD